MKKGMWVAMAALGMTACSGGGKNSSNGLQSSVLVAEKAANPEQCPAIEGTYQAADQSHRPYRIAKDSAGYLWLKTSSDQIRLDGVRREMRTGGQAVAYCSNQSAIIEGTDASGKSTKTVFTANGETLEAKVTAEGKDYSVEYRRTAGPAPAAKPAPEASAPGVVTSKLGDGTCPQLSGRFQLIETGKPPANNPVVTTVARLATGVTQVVTPDQASYLVDGAPHRDTNGQVRLAYCDRGNFILIAGADAPADRQLKYRMAPTADGFQLEGPGAEGKPQTAQYRQTK